MCTWHSIPRTLDLARWSHRYGQDRTEALPMTREMQGWQWGGWWLASMVPSCFSALYLVAIKKLWLILPLTLEDRKACALPTSRRAFQGGKTSLFANKFLGKENSTRSKRLKACAEFIQLICLCWQECLACLSVGHAPEPSQCSGMVPACRTAFWALQCFERRSPTS